jgi:hypothetical protein
MAFAKILLLENENGLPQVDDCFKAIFPQAGEMKK